MSLYDISSYIHDVEEKHHCKGTMNMTLNGITKRVKVAILKDIYNFTGHQPHICTWLGSNELEAVLEDNSVVKAEYVEYFGSPPKWSNVWNQRNVKQKKVLEYRFKG